MRSNSKSWIFTLGLLLLGANPPVGRAQWLEQTFQLTNGWNAVHFHVDLTHKTLREIIDVEVNPDTPIQEIWLWNAATQGQYTTDPYVPVVTGERWTTWKRSQPALSDLQLIAGNSACLILVTNDMTWTVTGRPVPPKREWRSNGQNLLGFSVPESSPPTFEQFLEPARLTSPLTFYLYGASSSTPVLLGDSSARAIRRGESFWATSGDPTFAGYAGPFAVELPGFDRMDFGDRLSQARLVLRNVTTNQLVVTMTLIPSATPPAGSPAIAGNPPLLLRGALDASTLTYAYSRLNDLPGTFTLAGTGQPGSETEVVLGLNRSAMTGTPGSVFAGVLRLTDSLNHSQVDFPVVSAIPSSSGLWVGQATITQVRHSLKSYQMNGDVPATTTGGQYIVSGENTSLGVVARAASLRLIVHSDGTNASLLQRVFYGPRVGGQLVLATSQNLLDPAQLKNSRRMSATHLPWTAENHRWPMAGRLGIGENLTATVALPYDDQASNPFLHTYHPDHDNLDPRFEQTLPQGEESYQVVRVMTLTQRSPAEDFNGLTAGGLRVDGDYDETITINAKPGDSRTFQVRGIYTLARVSDIAALSEP